MSQAASEEILQDAPDTAKSDGILDANVLVSESALGHPRCVSFPQDGLKLSVGESFPIANRPFGCQPVLPTECSTPADRTGERGSGWAGLRSRSSAGGRYRTRTGSAAADSAPPLKSMPSEGRPAPADKPWPRWEDSKPAPVQHNSVVVNRLLPAG